MKFRCMAFFHKQIIDFNANAFVTESFLTPHCCFDRFCNIHFTVSHNSKRLKDVVSGLINFFFCVCVPLSVVVRCVFFCFVFCRFFNVFEFFACKIYYSNFGSTQRAKSVQIYISVLDVEAWRQFVRSISIENFPNRQQENKFAFEHLDWRIMVIDFVLCGDGGGAVDSEIVIYRLG